MRSSPEAQRNLLQEDVTKTKAALFALERGKFLTGMLLQESKDKLSYSQNFLDGHYKFTFLTQGDPQTGKTTFLNVLLDDAVVPSSGHNAIIMVQYDESREIPALFTARLNEIFNSDRQIFVIKPGTLRDTGVSGRANIYSTLKEASKIVNPMSESMNLSWFRSGQTVFVIKYRISWLKEMIGDDFILNRIQFMDIDMPPENDPNPENLLRLERIISSPDHANIFVADCMHLFTIDIAGKYKELHEHKEKSLLIMNRTDQLGVKEHIQKIKNNKTIERLCSKLKIDFQTIETRVQKSQVTEEMRCEIFLQSFYESFYEDPDIGQDNLTDGDVIYFVSALFAFNRVLLCKYKECGHNEEKAAFCSLFNQRNKNNPVYQNNRRNAALKKLDILQYYLQEEPAMYQNNFEPVKKAISKIAKTKFANLGDELIQKVEEVRLRISDCRSYLTDALSENQIRGLKTLRGQIKDMIEERSMTFTELVNNFKGKIINLFEGFLNGIKDINTDYYVVKANNAKELTDMTHQFDEEINETAARFRRDYSNMETRYNEEIHKLGLAHTDKQYMSCYITNNVRSEYRALERENESLMNVIEGLAIWAANIIITFIADGKEIGKITNLLRMFAKFFRNTNASGSFDLRVKNSKSTFEETTRSLMSSHCEEEKKKRDKFEENFRDYLSNANSGNIERAQLIIQEYFG